MRKKIDSYNLFAQNEDFLASQKEEQELVPMTMKMSEKSFEPVWGNCEDSVYDEL